jgi:hypothetical protein
MSSTTCGQAGDINTQLLQPLHTLTVLLLLCLLLLSLPLPPHAAQHA